MLRIGIDIREERLILVNRGELNFDFHADSRRRQRLRGAVEHEQLASLSVGLDEVQVGEASAREQVVERVGLYLLDVRRVEPFGLGKAFEKGRIRLENRAQATILRDVERDRSGVVVERGVKERARTLAPVRLLDQPEILTLIRLEPEHAQMPLGGGPVSLEAAARPDVCEHQLGAADTRRRCTGR
ncbi:MAG TPA: hypothetical protein VEL79_18525 [Vicinamibacterales bacterium]|nr:hypothetical protein [Vicinamibacterales bacterium]